MIKKSTDDSAVIKVLASSQTLLHCVLFVEVSSGGLLIWDQSAVLQSAQSCQMIDSTEQANSCVNVHTGIRF